MKSKLISKAVALVFPLLVTVPVYAQDSEVPVAAVKSQNDDTSVNVILTPIPGKQTAKQIPISSTTLPTKTQDATTAPRGVTPHAQKPHPDVASKTHEKPKEEMKNTSGAQKNEGNFSPVQYFSTPSPMDMKEKTAQASEPKTGNVFEEMASTNKNNATNLQVPPPKATTTKVQKAISSTIASDMPAEQKREEHQSAKLGLLFGLFAAIGAGIWLKAHKTKADDTDLVKKML